MKGEERIKNDFQFLTLNNWMDGRNTGEKLIIPDYEDQMRYISSICKLNKFYKRQYIFKLYVN